jgi:3-oxoacyl-[acyl-carrier-protein] synthase II
MSKAGPPRVVITGIGLISPLGNDPQTVWQALVDGRSGIGPLTTPALQHLPVPFGAEAWEFQGAIDDFGPLDPTVKRNLRKGLKVMCREIQMGVAAAQRALNDSQWIADQLDPERTGSIFGSDYITTLPDEFSGAVARCGGKDGQFAFDRWGDDGIPQISPLWLLKYLPNMPACHVAIYNDLRGPNNSITVREASSNLALMEAVTTIQRGWADVLVTGATGSRLHSLRSLHICLQETLAQLNGQGQPAQLSRPFDRRRTGMVLGEGAAAMILEREDVAERRGARVYGEVVGFGSSAVLDRRGVGNRQQALVNVMQQALARAGMDAERVGHVHAHGLGTWLSDAEEGQALGRIFGTRRQELPVVAAKSAFGNLGAASGMVETIVSLLSLHNGPLFPILNLEELDEQCLAPSGPLRPVAAVTPVTAGHPPAGSNVLNINVTPQGQASAALIVRR